MEIKILESKQNSIKKKCFAKVFITFEIGTGPLY